MVEVVRLNTYFYSQRYNVSIHDQCLASTRVIIEKFSPRHIRHLIRVVLITTAKQDGLWIEDGTRSGKNEPLSLCSDDPPRRDTPSGLLIDGRASYILTEY